MDKCIILCIIIWIVVTPLIDLDCTWSCFRVLIVASLFCHIHKLFMFSTAIFWKTKKPECVMWEREKENEWNRDRLHHRHHRFLFLLLCYFQMGILWWKEHNLLAQNETRIETHTHTKFNERSSRKKQKKKHKKQQSFTKMML